jgi:hypothetical protein
MVPTIAFVHLNSAIPLYLKMNIQTTIKKFPDSRVVLIHNLDSQIRINSKVETFRYEPSDSSKEILSYLSHPRGFRNNFWFSAIQRFDALRQYLEQHSEPVLHIESDVILSRDFPLSNFQFIKGQIAFPLVAINRGVASSLYLSDLTTAERLVELSLELSKINSSITDMEILARHSLLYPEHTLQLGFGPNSTEAYDEEFALESCDSSFKNFKGVFDGNDIGVYLFGSDPRNSRGISYLGKSVSGNYAKIRSWGFVHDHKRRFINVEFNSRSLPIFSVHATCKHLLLFNRHTQNWMINNYLNRARRQKKVKKYPLVFVMMGIRKLAKLLNGQKNI